MVVNGYAVYVGVTLRDRIRNYVTRRRCGMKDDVVIRIKKGMLRFWFGYVEMIDVSRITTKMFLMYVVGIVNLGIHITTI